MQCRKPNQVGDDVVAGGDFGVVVVVFVLRFYCHGCYFCLSSRLWWFSCDSV